MAEILKLGLVQMTSTNTHADNIAFAQKQVAQKSTDSGSIQALPRFKEALTAAF